MSESGWTDELIAERKREIVERGKQFLSEQERVRAAKGFVGALSEMAGVRPRRQLDRKADGPQQAAERRANKPRAHPEDSQAEDWIRRTSKPTRKQRSHPERDLQESCEALLQLDGWRIFRMEQNYSERKRKVVGEPGVPDTLAIRYSGYEHHHAADSTSQVRHDEVLWLEWKSLTGKLSQHQRLWHAAERARGGFTQIAGVDFPATVDGFLEWYRGSGLMRRKLRSTTQDGR